MNGSRKSDKPVVPEKPANKVCGAPQTAESVEERGLAKRNSDQQNKSRTQQRGILQNKLDRIRQKAREDKELQFTTLWHHVYDVDRLRNAYFSVKRNASAGIDNVTWREYGKNLEDNLLDLSARLKRGAYKAKPVRRQYIAKPDGQKRPLGIPVLEDKIAQRATVEVMNAIYEEDFCGFSYGCRPGRSAHNGLDAVTVGIESKKISWVLDADIQRFYDAVDQEWLVKFVEHRISDKRVIRHIKKWLNAGVLEDGVISRAKEGTPQGTSVSSLLANIYLHYVFDLWAQKWRRTQAKGDVIIIRFADDIVMGFQYEFEAKRFHEEMRERLRKFKLELHPDKTKLLEFGRFAASNRRKKGQGKPETFDFLGFTHISGKTRKGKFAVVRKTIKKKMRTKLQEVKKKLRDKMHNSVPEVGKWLASVLRGHYQFYGVPRNTYAMSAFRWAIVRLWYQTLGRRSQKKRLTWKRMNKLAKRWLPVPKIVHPYPNQRLCVNTQGRSPVR